MGVTQLLQQDFSRGQVYDFSQRYVPANGLWRCVDYIPSLLDAPLAKRGGFSAVSPPLPSGSYGGACAFAPFANGAKLLIWDESGNLFTVNEANAFPLGLTTLPVSKPVFWREKLYWAAGSDGASTPKVYDGSSVSDIDATCPAGMYLTVFNDHLVVAHNRAVYFSDRGGLVSFDQTNSYFQLSHAETGIATIRGGLLAFGLDAVTRLYGTTPPAVGAVNKGAGDMTMEVIWSEGCIDARSICKWNDQVVYAHTTGLYLTDGSNRSDLALQGGMSQRWLALMADWQPNWTVACGVMNGRLHVTVANETTELASFLINLQTRTWSELSNMHGHFFAESYGGVSELYFSRRTSTPLYRISSIYEPGGYDADGTPVLPYLEFGYKDLGVAALKVWRELLVGYDLRPTGEETPTLELSVSREPLPSDWKTLPDLLPATDRFARKARPLRVEAAGVCVRLQQTAASEATRIYSLEATVNGEEGSKT